MSGKKLGRILWLYHAHICALVEVTAGIPLTQPPEYVLDPIAPEMALELQQTTREHASKVWLGSEIGWV